MQIKRLLNDREVFVGDRVFDAQEQRINQTSITLSRAILRCSNYFFCFYDILDESVRLGVLKIYWAIPLGFVFNDQKSTNSLNGFSVKNPTGGGSFGEPPFMKLEKLSANSSTVRPTCF